jgi:hypothetical protein
VIVVIPTNRSIRLDYLEPLIDAGARFIVVDDSEGSVKIDHPQFRVYHWGDRRRMLGALDVGIPRRNGACRDFGFYVAWKESDDDEIILALDDDCLVYHPDFADRVESVLSTQPRSVVTCEGLHLNVLDLYTDVPHDLYPRGFPYSARAAYAGSSAKETVARPVKFSVGLWKEVFDVNAIDKLQSPGWCHPDAELRHDSVIIAPGKLVSVCGMNMAFRREVLPAVYQLPMAVNVAPGWVVDRYGDIWGGFILKTLMDLRGDAMAAGGPMIRHLKEGSFQRNIWQEHICHLVNDEFVNLLQAAAGVVSPTSYVAMMAGLNEELRRATSALSPLLRIYVEHLTVAVDAWVAAIA